jgi:hypothetical protein
VSACERDYGASKFSPRASGEFAVSVRRKHGSSVVVVCALAGFIALVCGVGVATADVATMGELREVPPALKSSPGEVEPFTSVENEDYECIAKYSDLQAGAFSWVIGNCQRGATLEAVIRQLHKDSEPEGDYSLGGWVGGGFQGCGWIEEDNFKPKPKKVKSTATCSEISSGEHKIEEAAFMEWHNNGVGDGYFVVNNTSCPEYANYRPWSSSNIEKELIRTAPAYAEQTPGSKIPALKWRYVTKYASTDATGHYVMVRDDRFSAGEGNWVFVPASCLPYTLPQNENERVPSPPSVSTGTASGVQTPNATLNGTVNPNGLSTKYHFEYGTTTAYGTSTSEGSAGAGTSGVPESAGITGLAAGATYYYRITATSPTGTSYGNAQSFATQPPPRVSTSAPSGVQQTLATLNANVNPNGLETKYRFEYGTSTAYGVLTLEAGAGSGTNWAPVSSVITELQPGVIYHYRIVAYSSAGISYGSDQTFSTLSAEYVVYRGNDGGLKNWYWNGSVWEFGPIGSAGTVAGNPSIVLSPEGQRLSRGIVHIFYRGINGGLQNWYWNGAVWSFSPIGPEKVMAGDPRAVALPDGHIYVFYRGTNGGLQNWLWNGSTWSFGTIGSEKMMAGEPSPVILPGEQVDIFYRGIKNGLQNWLWNSSTWSFSPIGSENAMAGDSFGLGLPEGHMDVFYRGTNGGLQNWYWSSPTWSFGAIGSENAMVSDPHAVTWPNGNMDVFYRGPKEVLENWLWSTPYWSFGSLGGENAVAGEPSAVAW